MYVFDEMDTRAFCVTYDWDDYREKQTGKLLYSINNEYENTSVSIFIIHNVILRTKRMKICDLKRCYSRS